MINEKQLECSFEVLYTECMKNRVRQFKSTEEIELFLAEKDCGTLDNIYENITDEWEGEEDIVRQFNIAVENLAVFF